jgi:hypothetical protein
MMKKIWSYLLPLLLVWGLVSCGGDRLEATPSPNEQLKASTAASKLLEVATPKIIQELRNSLDRYHPEVTILSPQADTVFGDTTVKVTFQVKDLPIFKNSQLDAGNHLNLVLDNEPIRSVYDLKEPVVLENLAAGTHTLRVFAARPWEESFKNEGAFTSTTFHVLTKTGDNTPNNNLPLLTYNSPSGVYGAEPIMLDFYLNNAPLHLVAKQSPDDEIKDWRIRVTVNGENFVLDNWLPVYLKGFQKGKNWVQIEYIDENGQNVANTFNNTVRVITYDPKEKNTLARLVKNELSLEVAKGIIEPSYTAPDIMPVIPTPEPEIEEVQPEVTPATKKVAPKIETEPKIETVIEVKPNQSESKNKIKIEEKPTETIKSPEKIESKPVVEEKQPIVPEVPQTQVKMPVVPDNTPIVEPSVLEPEIAPIVEPTTEVEKKEKIKTEKVGRPKWLNENILDRLKSSKKIEKNETIAPKEETTVTETGV